MGSSWSPNPPPEKEPRPAWKGWGNEPTEPERPAPSGGAGSPFDAHTPDALAGPPLFAEQAATPSPSPTQPGTYRLSSRSTVRPIAGVRAAQRATGSGVFSDSTTLPDAPSGMLGKAPAFQATRKQNQEKSGGKGKPGKHQGKIGKGRGKNQQRDARTQSLSQASQGPVTGFAAADAVTLTDMPVDVTKLRGGGTSVIEGAVTAWRESEKRAKVTTLGVGTTALLVLLLSAVLLFNPFAQTNAFGFAPGTHVIINHSNKVNIIAGGTGATPTPTPTLAPTATPTRPPANVGGAPAPAPTNTPTPTPTPSPTPTITPTPTPVPVDGANITSNSGSTTQNPGAGFSISFTVQNTGNTTWSSSAGYVLVCLSGCGWGSGSAAVSGSVPPNQSTTFTIGMTAPNGGANIVNQNYATNGTTWQMQHNGAAFGNQSGLTMAVHGWSTAYGPMTPCAGSNGWVQTNATAGCGTLQTTGSYYPEMDLQGWKVSNSGQFRMEVHVNLTTYNSGNYEPDLVVDTPQSPALGGADFGARANGTWTVWKCCSGNIPVVLAQSSTTPSTSYDLAAVVSGGTVHFYLNGNEVWSTSTGNANLNGNEQGVMQWWNVQSSNDTSNWSNFQLANWQ